MAGGIMARAMRHLPAVAVLAASALAGHLAARAGVPLPWVLGPLFATAAGALMGLRVFASDNGRKAGQLVVGAAIGLRMSAEAAGLILIWFPAMLVTSAVSLMVTVLIAVPYARAARLDTVTGFFSLTPGGLSEMARTGEKAGGQPEPIALTQTMRIALLVTVLPSLLLAFGSDGGFPEPPDRGLLGVGPIAAVLAASAALVWLGRRIGMNNPWMIGGLLGGGVAAGAGLVEGALPDLLFLGGQFLIGVALGGRFRREVMAALPRVALMSALFIVLMTAALFGYAALLHLATGLDLSSAALIASPGGLAEMTLTAQVLHLNVALIVAFHIVRAFVVNAFSHHVFYLMRDRGVFRRIERLFG